jgi:phage gp36-like protein
MATPYATRDQLPDFGVNAAALLPIPAAVQDAALAAASEVADSYLRSQFVLPLITWGTDLTRAVCMIAAYDLLVGRGYNPEAGADTNIRLRYEDAIAWLKDVARGLAALDATDSSPGGEPGSSTLAGPRVASSSQRGYSIRGTNDPRGPFQGD